MKYVCLICFILVVAGLSGIGKAVREGGCGNVRFEAMKLLPCASAAEREDAEVSGGCCSAVEKLLPNPRCLCAIVQSDIARSTGANPYIAFTIPKRCGIIDRPIGYKCGDYTLP
ncbi:hypothetical protein MKW98_006100 [Papaver atlanticum]|uniref:Bifunctional inhibitor/plant lipid transfer protein/seed storage helical domain-containing protein n=1 Tax=Papaver atlanticum TaxID=357466 RepID=A0AAD4TGT7_9MAGN|nr:hypothetical protein MKW98_006100 [Papaver atlanticum]